MSKFKNCRVVILATNEKSDGCIGIVKKTISDRKISDLDYFHSKLLFSDEYYTPAHLYITLFDVIREGDWYLSENSGKAYIDQCKSRTSYYIMGTKDWSEPEHNCKKIIATTNLSLVINNYSNVDRLEDIEVKIPQIPEDFVKEYVENYNKGKLITDVLVEYETKQHFEANKNKRKNPANGVWYEDILKVNPKDNTITIKTPKDSWGREEVIELFNKLYKTDIIDAHVKGVDYNKWIEQNL